MIGVLALQGAFLEHERMLSLLGEPCREIRRRSHFTSGLDGLIFPGGESTAQSKLLKEEGLFEPVKEAIEGGLPVFGTCAGLILLARELVGGNVCFGLLDATVRRNAYGRQLGSFCAEVEFQGVGAYPAVFIRAPYVEKCGNGVEILAVHEGKIVAVRQKNLLAAAFHPELTDDVRIHEFFLNTVRK